MLKKLFLFASLLGLLAGCLPVAQPQPTAYPTDYIPTIVALTGQAALATIFALTPSPLPSDTPLPSETPIPPTPLPTWTPTLEPGFDKFAQIRFLQPGPMSKVVSPLDLKMLITAGESDKIKVELLGEDARPLFSKMEKLLNSNGESYRSWKIPFEIRAVSEQAWIQVSTKDAQGRIQSLNTLPILLLSNGPGEINRPGNIIYERCVLDYPTDGQAVAGGVLVVKGRFWPFNAQPMFLELLNEQGKTVGTRLVTFKGIDPEYFETTIPYKTAEPINARLTIKQVDPGLNIPVYIFTTELILNP